METQRKCSLKKHFDVNAINYCVECNIFMCNKCSNYHDEVLENHKKYNVNENNYELFWNMQRD